LSSREPLRVGATLDGLEVPAWIEALLVAIDDDPALDLVALVPAAAPPRRTSAAFRLYERIDARLYATPHDPFAPRTLSPRFDNVPRSGASVDVMLRLGSAPADAGARLGVWSLEHGEGEPPFFAEMERGDAVTPVTVRTDDGKVVAQSYSATDISSLHRGRVGAYWKGVHVMLRALRAMQREGTAVVDEPRPSDAPRPSDTPRPSGTPASSDAPPRSPAPPLSAPAVARFAARTWGGVAWRALRRRRHREDWVVGWRRRPPSSAPGAPEAGPPFTFVDPPPGHFWADPFLLERDGRAWLFVEDLDWSLGRAGIAVAELTDAGPSELRPILSPPHHLSYPFVFEHDGETYLVPESAAARTIELYRATDFPYEWERVTTLMDDVEAYDTTLLDRNGRWWMFVTIAVPGGAVVDELFLFYADSLIGPFQAHPKNPVVSDVRCARSAGRVFERDGHLIRPGQDSTGRYGRAIVWREIDVLTTEDYEEHTAGRFDPEQLPATLATHTYDFSESYEVVDALRRRRR
jgi:hypothetical protein